MQRIAFWILPLGLAMAQSHPGPSHEKPVALYPGLGIWHHPIATRNAEAQKFFDQGLTLAYGFNRYEALRSFRRAAELDPTAAMAYWGIAIAQGPYINMDGDPSFDNKSACAAVSAGQKLSGVPPRERAYLDAVATWCPEYRPTVYAEAMRNLAARYPDDLDAATFFADSLMIPTRWHWYRADGTPAPGIPEAERTLEGVLRRWPDHPGANHLYIHAVESSQTPERAIASAQRLMGIVPSAGHMVHMPGHIWLILGDWEMAASVNERAVQVDQNYFSATHVMGGSYMPYYIHNLHFVLYARSMQGRKHDALEAASRLLSEMEPVVDAMPEWADSFLPVPMLAYVRFGDWDSLLKMPQPKPGMKTSTTVWHFGRAMALSAKGDKPGAARERDAFEKMRAQVAVEAPWGQNKASVLLHLASEVISARLADSPAEAIPHWQRAVQMQDTLVYDEPPAWYYPLRESLGAEQLRAGRPADAEQTFREGVKRSPRNGRMLFGLLQSLQAQRKQEDAAWVKREFEANWAKADISLSLAAL